MQTMLTVSTCVIVGVSWDELCHYKVDNGDGGIHVHQSKVPAHFNSAITG